LYLQYPVDVTNQLQSGYRYAEEGINPSRYLQRAVLPSGHALPRLGKGGANNKRSWQFMRLPY
jgi:hypothetical protein